MTKSTSELSIQLRLAPRSAQLDVGKDAADIGDGGGEPLHLAHALVHLFQPLGDARKGVGEFAVDGARELLVHRLADALQVLGVDVHDVLQVLREAVADVREVCLRRAVQPFQGAGVIVGEFADGVRLSLQFFQLLQDGAVPAFFALQKQNDDEQQAQRT